MIDWRPVLAGLALAITVMASAPAAPAADRPGAVTPPAPIDRILPPSRSGGSWSARVVAPVAARARPGTGRVLTGLGVATTWSHHPQSLLVLDTRESPDGRQWLKVLLPIRPVGAAGWIPRDRAVLRKSNLWIEIRKQNRWLYAFRNGRRIGRFRIVIGAPGTPTPAGLAAVYERNRQPDPKEFLGPWSLSLTALSRTLKNYGGGPGRIAMHGRGGDSYADPLGSAASHGCIRIPNPGIRWLARIAAPGTPVAIRN